MDNGIALIPGDRATEGLLLLRSILKIYICPTGLNTANHS